MRRFAYGIVAGITAVFGGLVTAYAAVALLWPANLPPPALSPLLALDMKLRFLREHPALDPHVLAIGSSVTWRQIDGAAFEGRVAGKGHFLNGATVYLAIHQTQDFLDFYLAHYPNVRSVLLMVGPPDFDDCGEEPARLFDHDDAAAYVFGKWPAFYFYLRYFSPKRYVQAGLNLAGRQTPFYGDVFLDAYGSGPVLVPESRIRGLRYGAIDPSPACVDVLVDMSHQLTSRGLDLVLVFPPLHPDYRRAYPGVVRRLHEIADRVQERTHGDRIAILRMEEHPGFDSNDFYDAVHLQWPGVVRLSTLVAREMMRRNKTMVEDGGSLRFTKGVEKPVAVPVSTGQKSPGP